MIKRFLAVIFCVLSTGALAQDGVFQDYKQLRSVLDPLMKSRQISSVLRQFGGSDEMTPEELAALDERMQTYYKQDFKEVALIKRVDMIKGWRQELLAYWVGYKYVYVYMLLHQRDGEIVSINFKFNSDFDEINSAF